MDHWLAKLRLLCDTDKQKTLKFGSKILSNIINNPNNDKYRNLNIKRIPKLNGKFGNTLLEDLLYLSGFNKNNTPARLILNLNTIDDAKNVYYQLISEQNGGCSIEIAELISLGYTKEESERAIKLSHSNNPTSTQNQNDLKQLVNTGFDTTSNLQELINMGFTHNEAKWALEKYGNDVNAAANKLILLKSDYNHCHGMISSCPFFKGLLSLMTKYQLSGFCEQNQIVMMINDFNHLLLKHKTEQEFKFVYESFGVCNVLNCNSMKRIYRRRMITDVDNIDEQEHKTNNTYDHIIDKIHCYFAHSYDIGHRMASDDNKDDEKAKQNVFSKFSAGVHLEKFSQLKQTDCKQNEINKQFRIPYCQYSFGQRFYYWPHFDINQLDASQPGYCYCKWYIEPKYNSLKEELAQKIAIGEWDVMHSKAAYYIQSSYVKDTLVARPTGSNDMFPVNNTSLYGYQQGTPITLSHLIAIIAYCGYTQLSYSFSETFRRLNLKKTFPKVKKRIRKYRKRQKLTHQQIKQNFINGFVQSYINKRDSTKESDVSLKQRHSHFYHLAKYIVEAVNLFSKRAMDMYNKHNKKAPVFYHGISNQMKFQSMTSEMLQPFSTTSVWEVAKIFSSKSGMILELKCNPFTRYFDCSWISDFSSEKEKLFINCFHPLIITNITNTLKSCNYRIYITAILIIDSCVSNLLYESDQTVMLRYIKARRNNRNISKNPMRYGAKEIDPRLQLLTVKLIKHQLHKQYPNKYQRIIKIDKYIDMMLNHICYKKTIVHLNWRMLNKEILNNICETESGYQGYLFLKHLLCTTDGKMLNFNIIFSLFPSVKGIIIDEMILTADSMECILKYIQSNGSKNKFNISIGVRINNVMNSNILIHQYKSRFSENGCIITYNYLVQMINIQKGITDFIKSNVNTQTIQQQAQIVVNNKMKSFGLK